MSDLISRQAAIDAICKDWCNSKYKDCKTPFNQETDDYYHCDGCGDVETLLALPSAETPTISEKHQLSEETPTDTPTDLISRHGVSAWLSNMGHDKLADMVMEERRFSSAEPRYMGCHGCVHYYQQQTALICRDCKRSYRDMYEDGEE